MANTCRPARRQPESAPDLDPIYTESAPDLLPICTESAPDLIRICTDGFDVAMSAALVVVKTGSLKCEHMFPLLFLCDRGVPHPKSKIKRNTESIIQSNGQIISGIGPQPTHNYQLTPRVLISVPRCPGFTKRYHGRTRRVDSFSAGRPLSRTKCLMIRRQEIR